MFERPPLWAGLVAGGVSVAVGAGLLAYALTTRSVEPDPAPAPEAEVLEQAAWTIRVRTIGAALGGKKGRDRAAEARPNLRRLVQEVYEAAFLEPDRLSEVVGKRFTPAAARSWRRARPGIPERADAVRTLARGAQIALYGTGSQAAARVRVVASAEVGARSIKIAHLATLWMGRVGGGWKVIGFELDQRRAA